MNHAAKYNLLFLTPAAAFVRDSLDIDVSKLEPLYEPAAVQFSFQTPGWYILLGVLVSLIGFFLFKWIRRYIKNRYRREALKNLDAIENRFINHNDISCLNDVLVLLKIVAIQTFGRQKVAQFYGENWIIFLEEKGKKTPFSKYSVAISTALYQNGEMDSADAKQIIELTRKWIKTHA